MTELDINRRRHKRALRADLAELAQMGADLERLVHLIPRAHIVFVELMADGLPSGGNGSEHTSGTGVDTSTAVESAIAQRERLDTARRRLHDQLMAARVALGAAYYSANVISGKLEPGKTDATPPGSGTCAACDRWVPGTDADRIRAGYCPADYAAWLRAGKPDRARFERHQRIDHQEEA